MKAKIICILVMMLLITITIPFVSGTDINKMFSPGVTDQEQSDTSETHFLENYKTHCQEFVNRGNIIEQVDVHIGCYYSGSEPMTLSIDKPLGNKLTFKTLTTADLPDNVQDWCTFDFPDVALNTGEKYYIVIEFDCCSEYEWSGAHGDPYPKGGSSHPDIDWDYAFRTIVDKSKPKLLITPFLNGLQIHPFLFSILQKLIQNLGQ